MCRNIKTLFNFVPPVTEEEIRAASLQFVRKVGGFNGSKERSFVGFRRLVAIAAVSSKLLSSLETNAAPRNRTEEAAKARSRAAQ